MWQILIINRQMKGDMRRQGGGSSRKFLIKEEGRLLFTWLEEVGGGGAIRNFYLQHIFPSSFDRNKDGSLTHLKKKTGVANFKCTMWFPRQQSFYFWKPLWDSGSCPNNNFTKSLIKTPNLISHLIQRLDIPVLFFLELFKSCCW